MLNSKIFLHLIAFLLFCVLTIGMTWPLILQLNTHVTPGQQPVMTVPYLNLWTLAWNHRWLQGESDNYWDANLFYPHQKTLAYSEPQFGTSLLTFPIILFGGNTVLAYNVALLIFFFGAGMSVYALCWWLFSQVSDISHIYRCIASCTAGILYAFCPYMFREIGVLQLLATMFPPLCLLGLHRFLLQKQWFDALLFTIGFLGCWYTCAYYGLFLSIFLVCFTILFWNRDLFQKRNLFRGLVTLVILIGGLLPLAYGMHSAKSEMSLDWTQETIQMLSVKFLEYFRLPLYSLFYERLLKLGDHQYSRFMGVMLFFLSCMGGIALFKKPFQVQHTKDTLPNGNNTVRKKSILKYWTLSYLQRCGIFYITMAFVAFILSLGMAFMPIYTKGLGIYRILVWLSPYNLLYKFLPGFSSIRSPHRFAIFMALFLAILAGIGMLWLCRRVRSRWRWVLILTLVSATILELSPLPLRLVKVPGSVDDLPQVYQHVKTLPSDTVLLELPMPSELSEQGLETTAQQVYRSSFHWQHLVNGYSGFAPETWLELVPVLAKSPPKIALSAMKGYGIEYILAQWDDMNQEERTLLSKLETQGHLKPIFRDDNQYTLYQIDNYQHEESKTVYPNLERIAIYENELQHRYVTLCFYYQMDPDDFLLVTPWQNEIEFKISWHKNVGEPILKESKPVLVKNIPYKQSQLLHAGSNAITIDIPAPPPGKYRVIIKHSLASHSVTKSGVCEIYPQGFVHFYEES